MPEIIAIVNQKGGVGKTTSAINIAACLAALNKKTLLIDADPQGNSTSGLGISKHNLKESFYDFMIEETPLANIVMETSFPDLYILPSNRDSLSLGRDLMNTENREVQLRKILDFQLEKSPYEFVIIDSPPNLEMLSINIMAAAKRLIIPTQPEYYGLEGLADLIETYKRIRETLNPGLSILGVLITMHMTTNNLSKEVTKNLRENMGGLIFETVIPRNVKLAEAPSYCQPIIAYDPKSSGSISYQAVTMEILARTSQNKTSSET
jgi:chromosome partitioning protein